MTGKGLEDATIPVGGSFWRAARENALLVAGYVLIGLHLVLLVVDALVAPGLAYRERQRWGSAVLLSTVIAPIFSMCLLLVGELLRRGTWGGASGHKPDALLPQGSNTVDLRMVPLAWHLVWLLAAFAASVVPLVMIAEDPWSERFTVWTVNGIIAVGTAGAILGSTVKKYAWLRGGSTRFQPEAVAHPALAKRAESSRSQSFWRWVGYRWRLDLWCCALGLVALWFAAQMLLTREAFESSTQSTTTVAFVLLPGGALLTLVALWAATQFWRSGEDLAGGESVA